MLKVGVAGVGRFGQHHARIYNELDECVLVGVHDIDPERGKEIASWNNTKFYPQFQDLIDNVDALSIVVPTRQHFEVARLPLQQGKHLLIEKPITVTLEEAEEIKKLAEANRCKVATGFLERFNPAVAAVRDMVDEINYFKSDRHGIWIGREVTADCIIDLMIHDIDFLNSLVRATARNIIALGDTAASKYIDTACCWISFDSGVEACLQANRVSANRVRTIELYSDKYHFSLDMLNHSAQMAERNHSRDGYAWQAIPVEKKEPLREELRAFISYVEDDNKTIARIDDAIEVLDISLQIVNAIGIS